jgi:hypothetical protein
LIGITHGRVTRTGSSQYGPWFTIAEVNHKRDGGTFTRSIMCSGKEAPNEGEYVAVQGFVMTKVDERDGNHYANVNLNGCSFSVMDAPAASEDYEGEIPF